IHDILLQFIDNWDWGGGHPNCGGIDHTVITWGGPIAIFRWDDIDDMDIKDFSIRGTVGRLHAIL
ncbi:MAG TPA: hypothetical protein VEL11_10080, partial [Candidatus Bathyarchaeia archaeon]|nr:hypothetical protein [Candidatus Bathyarchaeia archaeon]